MPRPASPTRYTKAQKAEAVTIALASDTRVAADRTGIPMRTINDWVNHPEFAELKQRTRDAVAEEMWVGIQMGMRALVRDLAHSDASLRDRAIAFGILYDKHALLTGGATSRSESRTLEDLSDADLINAIRAAERITGEAGAAAAPEAAPAGE